MQLISIDLGSYSIKFMNFHMEKNKIVYDSVRETIIDTDEYDVLADDIELDLQLRIVKNYLDDLTGEYRIILNAPSEIITTRFLTLPVNNRKKAQLMIPFQLEEDIPFSLANSHIASAVQTGKENSSALVNITPREDFTPFYEKLRQNDIAPKVVTSQDSVFQNFIKQNQEILPQSFCILDMGHTTTKAYFYFDNELVAIHKSYIAGKTISEVISENYKIEFDEATLYKHQNCFFLTQDQYEQVSEEQRTFASLMERAMAPLTHEFKRWEIGSRVLQGVGVSEVFITGGTSNIKNIHNFLAEKFETKTSFLNSFTNQVEAKAVDTDEKLRRKFTYANLQAQAYKDKSLLVNFLQGDFTIQGQSDLPLRSFAFIGVRAAMLTLLLIVSFSIERIIINKDIKSVDRSLSAIAKNPVLEMTARQRRIISTNPDTVFREVKKKQKAIAQEISVLQASAKTNALSSLTKVSGIVSGLDVEVVQFHSVSGGEFNIVFKAKDAQELKELDKVLNSSGIKDAFTDRNEKKLTITLSGVEE